MGFFIAIGREVYRFEGSVASFMLGGVFGSYFSNKYFSKKMLDECPCCNHQRPRGLLGPKYLNVRQFYKVKLGLIVISILCNWVIGFGLQNGVHCIWTLYIEE